MNRDSDSAQDLPASNPRLKPSQAQIGGSAIGPHAPGGAAGPISFVPVPISFVPMFTREQLREGIYLGQITEAQVAQSYRMTIDEVRCWLYPVVAAVPTNASEREARAALARSVLPLAAQVMWGVAL